jgi:hypothetical protein
MGTGWDVLQYIQLTKRYLIAIVLASLLTESKGEYVIDRTCVSFEIHKTKLVLMNPKQEYYCLI